MNWLKRAAAIAALFIYCGVASAQTATVAFSLKDVGVASISTANNYVRFELRNYSGIPRVSGSGVLVGAFKDFTPDGSGNISGSVYGNDAITPAGTFYRVCVWANSQQFRCGDYTITSGTTFNLASATPITSAPTATSTSVSTQVYIHNQASSSSTWTITHNFGDANTVCTPFSSANPPVKLATSSEALTDTNTYTITFSSPQTGKAICIRASNFTFTTQTLTDALVKTPAANQQISGAYTLTLDTGVVGKLNNILFVDGVKYAATTAGIQAALDALPAGGGTVDARGLQGTITLSSSVAVGGDTLLLGAATFTSAISSGAIFTVSTGGQIIGLGQNRTVITGSVDGASGIKATVAGGGSSYITIRGLQFNDTAGARTAGHAIWLDGSTDLARSNHIEDILITGFFDGVRLDSPIVSELRNIRVTSAKHDGFSVYGAATSVNFTVTYANAAVRHGYFFDGNQQYMSFNSTASDTNGGDGYHCDKTGATDCRFFTFNSPGAENNVGHSMYFLDGYGHVINAPKLATTTGTTKDNIRFDGTKQSVVNGGEAFGATGYAVNVLTSATPTTPSNILIWGGNWNAGVLGTFNDSNGVITRFTDSVLRLNSTNNGAAHQFAMQRSAGNSVAADVYGDGTNALVVGGKADGTGIVRGGVSSVWELFRIKSKGTALVAGDFGTPSAGCGSTASISAVATNSRDQTFEFSLTSAGTGQSANGCAVTFTFKDGTFTNAPFLTCQRNDLVATAGRVAHTTLSATAPVLTFVGTPVASDVYKIACNFLGN